MIKNATSLTDVPSLSRENIFDLEGAYIDALRKKPRDNRQGHFHPSAVGMCGRRNVYEFIRTPAIQTIEPDDLEIFYMGHAVHSLVQGKLAELAKTLKPKKIGYEFQAEVRYDPATDKLYNELRIGGTTDGILEIWTDTWKQRGILEIKSINSKGFDKLAGPKKDHVLQAHIYAYRFDCPVMWIWYFNKDTSRRKVYPLVYSPSLLNEALAKYEDWYIHATQGTLPSREESFFACPRCEYRNACQPESLTKIRPKKINVAKINLR
jgi:CRISPR/Cas system-associated exonuclease Cas4 (RecB family)